MLSLDTQTMIQSAEARALATSGPHGVNVVPVSVVTVVTDRIYLYNFFMQKTVDNVKADPDVALTAWSGLNGVQVKATAVYHTSGELYETEKAKMLEQFPERTLHGVLELTPTALFDCSAGANAGAPIPFTH